MQWGLPWWVGAGAVEAGVRAAAEGGFDILEVSLEEPWPHALDGGALGEAAADAGVALGLHAPWRAQSVGHPREVLSEAAREVARACLAVALDAGAPYLVLHVEPRDFGGYPRADIVARGLDHAEAAVDDLLKRSQGRVDVVVENTVSPLGTPEECAALLDRVPGAGFCFDPGHALIEEAAGVEGATDDPRAWADAVGARWRLLHLMDAHVTEEGHVMDHLVPGAGGLDVGAIVDAARDAGCDRCVVEAFHADLEGTPATPGDIGRAVAALREG